MPINENTTLPNQNCLYLAKSGSGKSQAMRQSPAIPKQGARVLLWDPSKDQATKTTRYFDSLSEYARAVQKAVRSGRGFRLAYSGVRSWQIFEQWCRIAWIIADGKRPTYLLIEELARCCKSPGDATPYHTLVLDEGRKYGLIYHATSQRPQNITKTAYENCERFVIGKQAARNHKTFAELIDVDIAEIKALEPMTFIMSPGWNGAEKETKTIPFDDFRIKLNL